VVSMSTFHTPKYRKRVATHVYLFTINCQVPVTVADLSKTCTVFARSEAGIVGSNPTQGMNV
jgi:hypothetical protein